MNKVLVLDRTYSVSKMRSSHFEVICVALDSLRKENCLKEGINVVSCFEEEYINLPVSEVPNQYLIHSMDCDRFLTRFPYDKRIEILGKEISFWKKILEAEKPDLIIGELITMEFVEVMYIEALKRNITFLTWCPSTFEGKTFWQECPYNSIMSKEFWTGTIVTDLHKGEAKRYVENVREKHLQPYYVNFKQPRISSMLFRFLRMYIGASRQVFSKKIKGNFIYEDYRSIYWGFVNNTLALICHSHDELIIDSSKEYFYYPMHYEPETAVTYVGDCYGDQPMLIGRIAHSLNVNQILIVKEHPQQRGILLTPTFRSLKKKYPNLLYIDGKESSFDIFNISKCIITLNGTAGWEALLCGKPVVVFGDVFYRDCPGAITCESFKELKQVLRKDEIPLPDIKEVQCFVEKLFARILPIRATSYKSEDIEFLKSQVEGFLKDE